jgi:hypothetical protein
MTKKTSELKKLLPEEFKIKEVIKVGDQRLFYFVSDQSDMKTVIFSFKESNEELIFLQLYYVKKTGIEKMIGFNSALVSTILEKWNLFFNHFQKDKQMRETRIRYLFTPITNTI